MATSPNYGWLEPDNTDLVKNGALAIRTLGNAIDTTMATMVPKSIVDAKGDLIAGTAADTTSRLAVGNNGETLVADSSTATGLRWQAPVAVNPIINGGSDIWQRSTSAAMNSSSYTYVGADRWLYYQSGGAGTVSRQTSSLEGIQYCQRLARNSGSTSTGNVVAFTNVESANSYAFAGKTVTFSFYARAGANYSAASSQMTAQLYTGTGTDQNLGFGGFTGSVTAVNQTPTLTTSWQRFQYTATLGSTVTQLGVWFQWTPVGTAGAADYVEVTGVQVEVGSVATPFRRSGGTIQGELAACQRYYFRTGGDNAYQYLSAGLAASSTDSRFGLQPPVSMRVAPTSLDYSTLATYDVGAAQILTVTNLTVANASKNITSLTATVASGLTTYHPLYLITNNSTSGYVGLSAEL